jgi:hypothetical protein
MAFQKFGDAVKQDNAFELKDEKVKTSTSKDEEDKKKKEKG